MFLNKFGFAQKFLVNFAFLYKKFKLDYVIEIWII